MTTDLASRLGSDARSANAFVAVSARARLASDKTLVAIETAGFACVIAVLAWAPRTLDLALPAAAIGALGLWGVIDHMRQSRRRTFRPLRKLLSGFQTLIAAAGIAAAIATGYAIIGRLMGTWVL